MTGDRPTYELLCEALDKLPLFASDKQIAEALVGKERASKWLKERMPTISAKSGFPRVDTFHEGRAVPLVRLFYRNYLGLTGHFPGVPDGEENLDVWKKRPRKNPSGE